MNTDYLVVLAVAVVGEEMGDLGGRMKLEGTNGGKKAR